MAEAAEAAPILDACRAALRFAGCTDYDEEVSDLIGAARAKMRAGGVSGEKSEDDADPLVRIAIKTYVKANFGMDNPDATRYAEAFESYVTQMKCTAEYGARS
ncbi:DNA-packaging protein [Eggerthella guodeyinii]|uniref:DNA-packaging protein n=1 Tax=Eggerthella guodeyinii TaxID=2690837 RepID=A0A6N7RMI5_9ACTN|nr:DNA-packaging protein [Eggerthella guodeyinii]MRX82252.1 DNA-packaging protein [Eggerthella guodeyinii]